VTNVFLIGYRGSGKTATARLLAERLGWTWSDADAVLEARHGRTIRQIFADEGEAGFRDKEAEVLADLAAGARQVIATGGGVILRAENRALLRRGLVVWLTAPAPVLWQRLQEDATTRDRRPALAGGGLEEIEQLLAARQPHYAACADLVVDTTQREPGAVAEEIAGWLVRRREGERGASAP
jgi:shikimate kinase